MPAIQKDKRDTNYVDSSRYKRYYGGLSLFSPKVPGCNTGSAVIGCKIRQITVIGAVNVTVGGPGRWTVTAGGTVTVTVTVRT